MWKTEFFDKARSRPTVEKHCALETAFLEWVDGGPSVGALRTVFDGFAGAGRFAGEELGSPLLLLQWVLSRADAGRFRFVFSESNALNHARLRASLGWFLGQPEAESYTVEHHTVEVRHTSFEQCAAGVLAADGDLFSFVDPYGYEGLRFSTLSALAARGDLVLHVASQALYTKLVSKNGASPRQGQKMDALLGGRISWEDLQREASALTSERAKTLIAEVLLQALERQRPALRSRLVALRDGDSHLLCTTLSPASTPGHSAP